MKLKLKIPPAVLALSIAAAMWWVDQYLSFQWATFADILWVSFTFLGIGGAFGLLGLLEFFKASTSIDPHAPHKASNLVTGGIYSMSRNPMYVGLLFILASYGIYLGNGLTLLLLPLFVGYMNRYQIIPEEKVMEDKFGEEFRKYKSEVRRWL